MTNQLSELHGILKQNGVSITQARRKVFEQLLHQEPLPMHELVQKVQGIDRASVYRTIDLFERLGIVQRLNTGWKYKLELTDTFAAHHHHLTCTQCGQTIPINEDQLEAFVVKLAQQYSFKLSVHQIELQGICQACQGSGVTSNPSSSQ